MLLGAPSKRVNLPIGPSPGRSDNARGVPHHNRILRYRPIDDAIGANYAISTKNDLAKNDRSGAYVHIVANCGHAPIAKVSPDRNVLPDKTVSPNRGLAVDHHTKTPIPETGAAPDVSSCGKPYTEYDAIDSTDEKRDSPQSGPMKDPTDLKDQ